MENASSSTTAPVFSCGMELASVVVASDVLIHAWETISGLNSVTESSGGSTSSLRINISEKRNSIIIALVAPQIENLEGLGAKDMVSTDALDKKKFPFIDHVCYKATESFSIHKMAANAFASAFDELDALYTQCARGSKPLIITGHSLGGSVASLFTLWLLCRVNPATTKLPLCVTFGAPLIGDGRLVKAVSKRFIWDSCFLNVVGERDPVPKHLASISSSMYEPFGTYLFTSQSGCACYNDPESVTLLLKATNFSGLGVQHFSLEHYREVVGILRRNLVVNVPSEDDEWTMRPQYVSVAAQLKAMGISRSQQWHENADIRQLHGSLVEHEQKARRLADTRSARDPSKKLNDIKIRMANLEWYKKKTRDEETGYYDSFKKNSAMTELEVQKYKRLLTKYWKEKVAQAEQKPQAEGRFLHTRDIGAGTNYRRMVEPLEIAEYYKQSSLDDIGNRPEHFKDYIANRHEHYTRLEEWLDADRVVDDKNTPRTSAPSLTEDSCFWARVEQAIVWCKSLSEGGPQPEVARYRLGQFEKYVWSLIEEKMVSSDIFLGRSSFMKWWQEYNAILPSIDYPEGLIKYMKNRYYANYK